jgi:cell division protein FtsB
MAASMSDLAWRAENRKLRAENERLRAGIQNYLDGNYDTAAKNDKCSHGRYGYEGCENCIDEHFVRLLNAQ